MAVKAELPKSSYVYPEIPEIFMVNGNRINRKVGKVVLIASAGEE